MKSAVFITLATGAAAFGSEQEPKSIDRRGGGNAAGSIYYADAMEAMEEAITALDMFRCEAFCVSEEGVRCDWKKACGFCQDAEDNYLCPDVVTERARAVNTEVDAMAAEELNAVNLYNDVYSYEVGCDTELCCPDPAHDGHVYLSGDTGSGCEMECCFANNLYYGSTDYVWATLDNHHVDSYWWGFDDDATQDAIDWAATKCDARCEGDGAVNWFEQYSTLNGQMAMCNGDGNFWPGKCEGCARCDTLVAEQPTCESFCADNANAGKCNWLKCQACDFC